MVVIRSLHRYSCIIKFLLPYAHHTRIKYVQLINERVPGFKFRVVMKLISVFHLELYMDDDAENKLLLPPGMLTSLYQ